MENRRTVEQIRAEIAKFLRWYHKIDLGNGIITPGLELDNIWNNIRESRKFIDYQGKIVLDLRIGMLSNIYAVKRVQKSRLQFIEQPLRVLINEYIVHRNMEVNDKIVDNIIFVETALDFE